MRLPSLSTPLLLAIAMALGCSALGDRTGPAASSASESASAAAAEVRLEAVLSAQPAEARARYSQRHPRETLTFFGIEPGMTVVEVLPSSGWYTRLLVPYLGSDGQLIGADYAHEMIGMFPFMTPEMLEKRKSWKATWPAQAAAYGGDDGAQIDAFVLGTLPSQLEGSADAILFIRALHNLARFEAKGGYLTTAISEAHRVLKPGGIVGVVQHEAREEMPDDWANGSAGYLKREFVIGKFQAAGFELIDESDVNQNPKDQPAANDIVWRLPPALSTSRKDPNLRAELEAVGESNRMTLKFRKKS